MEFRNRHNLSVKFHLLPRGIVLKGMPLSAALAREKLHSGEFDRGKLIKRLYIYVR